MGTSIRLRRGWFPLLHPGPSLLVTCCFVAAAAAALHRPPDVAEFLRLVALMLPLQFSIGVVNDLCDRDLDRRNRPTKPLVEGVVPVPAATALAVLLSLAGLAVAASFSLQTLAVALTGWGAGMAYDLGLKRRASSWVPWWIGFAALPICAWAAEHRLDPPVLGALPLALGLALGLHLANALPDIEGDAREGSAGLGVRLGARRSRRLSVALVAATGAVAVAAAPTLGQAPLPVILGGGFTLFGAGTVMSLRIARPFPILAAVAAVLAALWMLALP